MKLTNITNVDKFFEVVDKCEGKVELVTESGDRLNLKSKFNQYTALIKNEWLLMEIIAEEKKDTDRLMTLQVRLLYFLVKFQIIIDQTTFLTCYK